MATRTFNVTYVIHYISIGQRFSHVSSPIVPIGPKNCNELSLGKIQGATPGKGKWPVAKNLCPLYNSYFVIKLKNIGEH